MADDYTLPHPGEHRIWVGRHQPQKSTKPLRLELRERTNKDSPSPISVSLTRLIGFADTIALPSAMHEAALGILERASRVDEFVGIIPHKETT